MWGGEVEAVDMWKGDMEFCQIVHCNYKNYVLYGNFTRETIYLQWSLQLGIHRKEQVMVIIRTMNEVRMTEQRIIFKGSCMYYRQVVHCLEFSNLITIQ